MQPPVMVGCYSKVSKDPKNQRKGIGDLYSGGVSNLLLLKSGKLIVGSGNGAVEMVEIVDCRISRNKLAAGPSTPQLKTVEYI